MSCCFLLDKKRRLSCWNLTLRERLLGLRIAISHRTLQVWSTIKTNQRIRTFNTRVKLRYLLFKLLRWVSSSSNSLLFALPSTFCSRRFFIFQFNIWGVRLGIIVVIVCCLISQKSQFWQCFCSLNPYMTHQLSHEN